MKLDLAEAKRSVAQFKNHLQSDFQTRSFEQSRHLCDRAFDMDLLD